jgi:6-phosphogluconolactonase/glucosamine-6-phosphate isomerase/deaminase
MGLLWSKTSDLGVPIHALRDRLVMELEGGRKVLWLVPGGSNILAVARITRLIPTELTSRLSIMLTDERYGALAHADSNWLQLEQANWEPKHATLLPVLTGENLAATIKHYSNTFGHAVSDADIVIGLFGIGADGHIAGILPDSTAVRSKELVCAYDSPPYKRLTLTFEAIRKIDAAYAFVFGADKYAALSTLYSQELTLTQQPSQILKQLPEAYIYNNQIEGEES